MLDYEESGKKTSRVAFRTGDLTSVASLPPVRSPPGGAASGCKREKVDVHLGLEICQVSM